jgi:predicted MPP superfamily phosphohydrolase
MVINDRGDVYMFLLFMMFFTLMLPLAVILYARLVSPHKLSLKWRLIWGTVIAIVCVGVSLALPFSLKLSRDPVVYDQYHLGVILPWMYYLLTFVCLILFWVIGRDLLWVFVKVARFFRQRSAAKKSSDGMESGESGELVSASRRAFLKRVSTAVTVGGAVLSTPAAVYCAKRRRVVRHFDIPLSRLPEAADGLRIVHLSDIHVGNTIFEEDIADIVAETNHLNPDMIVITGDMADGLPEHIGSWLNPMREFRAKHGVWFVTGNHDHMWNAQGWIEVIRELGIRVLDNEHALIHVNGAEIAVAGAIDARGDRRKRSWQSNPEQALSGIEPGIFKLMLVHQPSSVDRCFSAGANLVLLGHTHGGQCWPLTYLIEAMHKYSRGLYWRSDGNAAFVSCGTGYWGPPLRIGVPPEIDVLTLHFEKKDKIA